MIIFNQETRQFSVVEESRDFSKKNWVKQNESWIIPAIQTTGGAATGIVGNVTSYKNKKDRRRGFQDYVNSKRAHKERMAMIRMGMDPSKVESESLREQRLKYADKADIRNYKIERHGLRNENRADARTAATDRMKVRSGRLQTMAADRADARDTKVEMRGLRNQDRMDNRKNKTQKVGIRQAGATDRTKAIAEYAGTANENRNKRKMVKYLAE